VTPRALLDNDSRDAKSLAAQRRANKRCPGCGTVKPLAEFALDVSRKTGIATYCKQCYIERSRRVICVDCGARCQRSRAQRGWVPPADQRCRPCYLRLRRGSVSAD
jgi:hypothetical protein